MLQIASAIAIATEENCNQTQLNINFNYIFIKYLFSIEYQFVSEEIIVAIVLPDDKATKLNGQIVLIIVVSCLFIFTKIWMPPIQQQQDEDNTHVHPSHPGTVQFQKNFALIKSTLNILSSDSFIYMLLVLYGAS